MSKYIIGFFAMGFFVLFISSFIHPDTHPDTHPDNAEYRTVADTDIKVVDGCKWIIVTSASGTDIEHMPTCKNTNHR